MNKLTALKIFGIKDGELTKREFRAKFRSLAKSMHPDKGGDEEQMKMLLEAYELLQTAYKFSNAGETDEFENDNKYWELTEEMERIYRKIYRFENIIIEVVGKWMWITGDTYNVKEELKELGMKYSRAKRAWYWKPGDKNSWRRGTKKSLEDIKDMFGSQVLKTEQMMMIGK